jgi:hypothetical protein
VTCHTRHVTKCALKGEPCGTFPHGTTPKILKISPSVYSLNSLSTLSLSAIGVTSAASLTDVSQVCSLTFHKSLKDIAITWTYFASFFDLGQCRLCQTVSCPNLLWTSTSRPTCLFLEQSQEAILWPNRLEDTSTNTLYASPHIQT